jgi:cobalt/nickel transport system permease protein
LFFTGYVVSVPKYQISPLIPLILLPFAWISFAGIPWRFVGKHILICSPFIVTLAVFNPMFDRTSHSVVILGQRVHLAGGYLVAVNLLVKYLLGLSCLVALASTTRFDHLLLALTKFRLPRILILQLSYLYRYLFELIEQAHEILRARRARSAGRLPFGVKIRSAAGMVGILFVRSYESSQKVFLAMQARLYNGELRPVHQLHVRAIDVVLFFSVITYLVFCFWITHQ